MASRALPLHHEAMLQDLHPLRTPLRWFASASLFGFLGTLPMALVFWGNTPRQLLLSGLVGALFSVVMWGGGALLGPWVFTPRPGQSPARYALLSQFRWLLVYAGLLALAMVLVRVLFGLNLAANPRSLVSNALVGYLLSSVILGIILTARMAEKARELEQVRAQAAFLALRAQLSPHTLFNGLNTVAALIPEDPRAAEAVVEGLSRLLRRILVALDRETWTLAEEFDLLEGLLDLERARFGDRLQATLTLPAALADRPLPPLLLLPLVENSLKHGFRTKVGPCRLEVTAGPQGVRVTDDGAGRDPRAPEGVGLRTVRQRVEALGGSLRWPEATAGCAVEVNPWP